MRRPSPPSACQPALDHADAVLSAARAVLAAVERLQAASGQDGAQRRERLRRAGPQTLAQVQARVAGIHDRAAARAEASAPAPRRAVRPSRGARFRDNLV
jgi:ElaB/YqjD/DUF883 family membrane-anchored ribosome-binding protein